MITLKKLCSSDFQKKQIKKHAEEQKELFLDLSHDLKEGFSSPFLSALFLQHLVPILKEAQTLSLSSHSFHFSQLLEQVIELNLLLEEEEDDENIFAFMDISFFSDLFSEIKDDSSIHEASKKIISLLEDQIISYFYLHLSNKKITFNEPVLYHMQPELSDSNLSLFIGTNLDEVSVNATLDNFPFIAIKTINKKDGFIEIESSSDIFELPITENKKSFTLGGKIIPYLGEDSFIEDIQKDSTGELSSLIENFTKILLFDCGDTELSHWGLSSLHPKTFLLKQELTLNASAHYLTTLDHSLHLLNDDIHTYFGPWSEEEQSISEIYAHVFNSSFLYILHKDKSLKEKIEISGPIIQEAFNRGEVTPIGNEVVEALFEAL